MSGAADCTSFEDWANGTVAGRATLDTLLVSAMADNLGAISSGAANRGRHARRQNHLLRDRGLDIDSGLARENGVFCVMSNAPRTVLCSLFYVQQLTIHKLHNLLKFS